MENNENYNKKRKWILNNFRCEGLEPHNRSLELIFDVLNGVGGTISDVGGGDLRYDTDNFAIRVTGSSGTLYRITVNYRSTAARLMAKRFNEIDFDSDNEMREHLVIGTLMHAFSTMMDFTVQWYDFRDGDWERICIHESREKTQNCWPGDLVVATILLLADDLRGALEPQMTTLRHELRNAYPVAWSARQTPPNVTFADVAKYSGYLKEMLGANNDTEELQEIRARAEKDLFDGGSVMGKPEQIEEEPNIAGFLWDTSEKNDFVNRGNIQ